MKTKEAKEEKKVYDRKDHIKLEERDSRILEMHDSGEKDANELATEFTLSAARIRQILRKNGRTPVAHDNTADDELMKKVIADIDTPLTHKELIDKYGEESIAKVNKILKADGKKKLFRLVVDRRDKNIVTDFKAGMSPLEITDKYIENGFFRGTQRSVRSYVYTLLNAHGQHSRLSEEEQVERDQKIIQQLGSGKKTVNELADEYDITPSAIRMMTKSKNRVKTDKKSVTEAKKKKVK